MSSGGTVSLFGTVEDFQAQNLRMECIKQATSLVEREINGVLWPAKTYSDKVLSIASDMYDFVIGKQKDA